MLAHLELGFDICHSCMQVTLLRLLGGSLRSHKLGDNWYLTTRNGIFKVDNSRVKPREAHPLKSVFCGLINLTLNAVIYNCIFNGWLIELPDSLFAYLTQVSQWVKSLVGGSQSILKLDQFRELTLNDQGRDSLCVKPLKLIAELGQFIEV
jgi:hypothetical protein